MVLWNITVTNIGSDSVPDAKVYLFTGGGGIEPAEQAAYTKDTINGVATFDVPADFYRVGIIAPGYESAYEPHNPPEEWKAFWTCWGAGGAGHDYDFAVTPVIEEPDEPVSLSLGQKLLIITAAIASVCGIAYVVVTKRK